MAEHGQDITLTRPEVCGLFEDLLSGGTAVRVRVTGGSMAPFLRGGEILTIEPLNPERLRIGDLVFFRKRGLPEPAVHRVIRIRHAGEGGILVQTQGDALNLPDEPVVLGDVLGKVRVVEREGDGGTSELDLAKWTWRSLGWWTACRKKGRALLVRAYAVLRGA